MSIACAAIKIDRVRNECRSTAVAQMSAVANRGLGGQRNSRCKPAILECIRWIACSGQRIWHDLYAPLHAPAHATVKVGQSARGISHRSTRGELTRTEVSFSFGAPCAIRDGEYLSRSVISWIYSCVSPAGNAIACSTARNLARLGETAIGYSTGLESSTNPAQVSTKVKPRRVACLLLDSTRSP